MPPNEVVAVENLDHAVECYVHEVLGAGLEAAAAAKRLARSVAHESPRDVRALTVETTARHRVPPEGQEGLRALLEKRRPAWAVGRTRDP